MENKVQIECGGKAITIETGKIAKQASGAVVISSGDTMVLVTAVATKTAKEGQDFFPLTVNYQEKAYAGGKIPGWFLQARSAPLGQRNPDLQSYRQADQTAFSGKLP